MVKRCLRCLRWFQFFARIGRFGYLLLATFIIGATLLGLFVWSEYHLRAALKDLDGYHLLQAQKHLQQSLQVRPSNWRINLLAGQTERRLGNFEAAERYFQKCQDMQDGPAEVLLLERVLARAQRGETDACVPYVRPLVEQDHPASVLILEAMTRGYLRYYRFGEARYMLDLWLQRRPDDIEGLLCLGWVLEETGRPDEAVDDYQRILTLEPTSDEAQLRLANLLLEKARFAEAEQHLDALNRRLPDNAAIMVRLGRCRYRLGRIEDARTILDQVIDQNPRFGPALTARGELALEAGDPESAEKWLRRSMALDPGDYQAHFLLYQCLQQSNQSEAAAEIQARLKRMEADMLRIRDIITKEIGNSRRDAALHQEVGVILLRSGRTREGLRWLYSALQIDPNYRPAHEALAAYYEQAGDSRRASLHGKESHARDKQTP